MMHSIFPFILLGSLLGSTPYNQADPYEQFQASRHDSSRVLAFVGAGLAGLVLGAGAVIGYHASEHYQTAVATKETATLEEAAQALERLNREAHDLLMLRTITLQDLMTYISYHGRQALIRYETQVQLFQNIINQYAEQTTQITGHYAANGEQQRTRARQLHAAYSTWKHTITNHTHVLHQLYVQRDKPLTKIKLAHQKLQNIELPVRSYADIIHPAVALDFAQKQFASTPTPAGLYGFPLISCSAHLAELLNDMINTYALLNTTLLQHDQEVQQALKQARQELNALSHISKTINAMPQLTYEIERQEAALREQALLKQQHKHAEIALQATCNQARALALEEERLTLMAADITARTTQSMLLASHIPCREREATLRAELERMQNKLDQRHANAAPQTVVIELHN